MVQAAGEASAQAREPEAPPAERAWQPDRRDGDSRRPSRGSRPEPPFGKKGPRPAGPPPPQGAAAEGTVTLAFSVGRDHNVRPADLVGAIAGESGISSRELGAIRIGTDASTVEVAGSVAAMVAKVMKGKTIRGEKVDVRVVR
jgi:ATP-dependent RNA helicase DeaD